MGKSRVLRPELRLEPLEPTVGEVVCIPGGDDPTRGEGREKIGVVRGMRGEKVLVEAYDRAGGEGVEYTHMGMPPMAYEHNWCCTMEGEDMTYILMLWDWKDVPEECEYIRNYGSRADGEDTDSEVEQETTDGLVVAAEDLEETTLDPTRDVVVLMTAHGCEESKASKAAKEAWATAAARYAHKPVFVVVEVGKEGPPGRSPTLAAQWGAVPAVLVARRENRPNQAGG